MGKKYPFKFLESYEKKDKDFFFGRTQEVDLLYKMIFKTRILVVYGTSGTGKTSLIQCGLANRFNSYDWLSLYVRRGTNLVEALDRTLCANSGNAFAYQKDQEEGIMNLAEKIEAVYKASFRPVYLIFDQFEELYVLGSKSEQQQFIKAIKKILSIDRPVKIILSIREEYLGHMYEFEREVPNLLRRKLRVEPMNIEKVSQVTQGINDYGDSLVKIKEEDLKAITKEIFERIKGKKEKSLTIQLPYLQVFLDKLYMNQTGDKDHLTPALITMKDLSEIGDIGNVMQDFLVQQVKEIEDELNAGKNKANADMIWAILSDFCTLEGTKEPISKKKLAKGLTDIDDKIIFAAVDKFAKRRILRHVEEGDLYELSHDSLALKIMERRSADVVKMLEIERFIKSKASLTGDLRVPFTEKEMIYIEPYLKKLKSKMGPSEKAFLKESEKKIKSDIRKKKRQERKKRHRVYWIFGLILFGILVGGFFLQRAFIRSEISNDVLKLNDYLRNAKSQMKESTNLLATDPTQALKKEKEIWAYLDTLDSLPSFKKIKDRNYFLASFFSNSFYDTYLDTLKLTKEDLKYELKGHSEWLLAKDDALYEIIDFKNVSTNTFGKEYTLAGDPFLNLIFPDSVQPGKFTIWSADESIVSRIYKARDSLMQMVFPLDTSEAMALYKDGNAEFIGNNGAYRKLQMEEVNDNGPAIINSIAPINYEVIGYKMLSALNNRKIVEWNLNGKIRHNIEPEKFGKVVYEKEDINLGERVLSIAISRKRDMIFTATEKGIGIVWPTNVANIKLLKDKKIAFSLEQDTVLCSSFSRDGSLVITGSSDGTAAIWCANNGKLVKKLKSKTDTLTSVNKVTSVAFSAHNKFVYTGSADGIFRKWALPRIVCDSLKPYEKWHNHREFKDVLNLKTRDSVSFGKPQVYSE